MDALLKPISNNGKPTVAGIGSGSLFRSGCSSCSGLRRKTQAAAAKSSATASSSAISERHAEDTLQVAETAQHAIADVAADAQGGPSSALAAAPVFLGLGAAALAAWAIKRDLDKPSRKYDSNVGDEYDAWEEEGILEYYWGEHIHLGTYTAEERAKGSFKKNFIQAKFDFVDEMYAWSGAQQPKTVLDVGCGIGGTSRHLAKKLPDAEVTGITLSPKQVARATQLAVKQGVSNASFQVMDALKMDLPDDSFDMVWACESGEHMPDKKKYVEEMTRVLKPGGTLVIACWCQRDETPDCAFTEADKANLQFLYDEWAHPFFISKEEFCRLMQGTGALAEVSCADWTEQTLPSWRHSIWVGVVDPWKVVFSSPRIWYKTVREIVTLERMHRAFDRGLMQYGMMKAVKPALSSATAGGRDSAAQPSASRE